MYRYSLNELRVCIYFVIVLSVSILDSSALAAFADLESKKPNVLFIVVDDLRPELGCYGASLVNSPNIDRLAKQSVVFNRAYCQQAVCSPSRTSVLTGLRPDTSMVRDLTTNFRDTVPDVITLPQYFLRHGYHTQSIGKIFHKPYMQDDKNSWSVPSQRGGAPGWVSPSSQQIIQQLQDEASKKKLTRKEKYYATLGPAYESADVSDDAYQDGIVTENAIEALRGYRENLNQPFFLAVGFVKPHLPFCAPKKYWGLYDPNQIELASNPSLPEDCPKQAVTNWNELRNYHGMPLEGPMPEEQARSLIHGYLACVSYMDAQVGRLLDELDRLDMDNDTIVVLWGDHGWKLGEHGLWSKHTNFEVDTRSPLIIRPQNPKKNQSNTEAIVELIDIYPTLCDLADLPIPSHVEGISLTSLLENQELAGKQAAFSQFPRGGYIGYSMKTDRYRYTEWTSKKSGEVQMRELYDHDNDPNENLNLAQKPEYNSLLNKLAELKQSKIKASEVKLRKPVQKTTVSISAGGMK